jgi:hypothetical protein
MASEGQRRLAAALQHQVMECQYLGSALYATILTRAADDIEASGLCWDILGEEAAERLRANPALQLMGAVHRLVLTRASPALVAFYPSAGGRLPQDAAGWERLWSAFLATLEEHRDAVRTLARRPVQTNEVARSAALAGGFLTVARETRLPLRLLELGASAGLNLRWDRYRYEARQGEAGQLAWGDCASPLRFTDVYTEGAPPLDTAAQVAERAGCDRAPLDAASPDDRLTLLSYIWADSTVRMQRLRAALALAAETPVRIDRADTLDWAAAQLAGARPSVATVVFHSIMLAYLTPEARIELRAIVEEAGWRASASAPLSWLRMEGESRGAHEAAVRLTMWPDGEERLLAYAGFHGQNVRWLAA